MSSFQSATADKRKVQSGSGLISVIKQRESGLPFDDIRTLLQQLPQANAEMADHTVERAHLAPGLGEGRLLELCKWYSAWSGRSPVIVSPLLTLFAGTHKVHTGETDWLLDRVTAIASGNAGVNRLCEAENLSLKLLDLALQIPVENIALEAAFDEKSCAGTIAFGMEAIAGGTDLMCLAAIEKTASPSVLALVSVLLDMSVDEVGAGIGISGEDVLALAAKAVERAGRFKSDPLELLRHLGGRETAAICGAVLAARSQHIPVILSGPSAVASALVLEHAQKGATDHCRLASGFADTGFHARLAGTGMGFVVETALSPEPAIDAVLAAQTVRAASLVLAEVQSG